MKKHLIKRKFHTRNTHTYIWKPFYIHTYFVFFSLYIIHKKIFIKISLFSKIFCRHFVFVQLKICFMCMCFSLSLVFSLFINISGSKHDYNFFSIKNYKVKSLTTFMLNVKHSKNFSQFFVWKMPNNYFLKITFLHRQKNNLILRTLTKQ